MLWCVGARETQIQDDGNLIRCPVLVSRFKRSIKFLLAGEAHCCAVATVGAISGVEPCRVVVSNVAAGGELQGEVDRRHEIGLVGRGDVGLVEGLVAHLGCGHGVNKLSPFREIPETTMVEVEGAVAAKGEGHAVEDVLLDLAFVHDSASAGLDDFEEDAEVGKGRAQAGSDVFVVALPDFSGGDGGRVGELWCAESTAEQAPKVVPDVDHARAVAVLLKAPDGHKDGVLGDFVSEVCGASDRIEGRCIHREAGAAYPACGEPVHGCDHEAIHLGDFIVMTKGGNRIAEESGNDEEHHVDMCGGARSGEERRLSVRLNCRAL